jgi:hypothetical protein
MRGQDLKRWHELSKQAVHDQDPQKLMKIIEEINKLLEAKETRLRSQTSRQAKD